MADTPDPKPMGDLPAFHAARRRGPAVTIGEGTLSWTELDARSTQRAREFAGRGVTEGSFVTVALPNAFAFYETTFAIWKLGAVPNIVSPKLPAPELAAIVDLARPALVVADDAVVPEGVPGYRLSEQAHRAQPTDPLPSRTLSPSRTRPASGGNTPAMVRNRVVLPDPFGPVNTTRSPARIDRFRPDSSGRSAKPTLRSCKATTSRPMWACCASSKSSFICQVRSGLATRSSAAR